MIYFNCRFQPWITSFLYHIFRFGPVGDHGKSQFPVISCERSHQMKSFSENSFSSSWQIFFEQKIWKNSSSFSVIPNTFYKYAKNSKSPNVNLLWFHDQVAILKYKNDFRSFTVSELLDIKKNSREIRKLGYVAQYNLVEIYSIKFGTISTTLSNWEVSQFIRKFFNLQYETSQVCTFVLNWLRN